MQKTFSALSLFIAILISSCTEEKPKYLILGKDSFDKGNYSLAKSQFSTIKAKDANYKKAQEFIRKIDSVEKIIRSTKSKTDSITKIASDKLREKYAGSYKIEVSGTSSKEQVEVYILHKEGKAEWLWVNYGKNKVGYSDDRKFGTWLADEKSLTIEIRGNSGMISETYLEKDGALINKQLSKRSLEKTNETFR
ncbi:MAG: hypothetical protein ABJJ05_13455 [Maribacter litoralis]|uniref:hypothetical protein n=1 Tax=Maribacter litoralis TaxID=2059726 RepID=UPI003297EC97